MENEIKDKISNEIHNTSIFPTTLITKIKKNNYRALTFFPSYCNDLYCVKEPLEQLK